MRAVLRDSELLLGRAEGSRYFREDATDAYVESPPAYIITESNGATWILGQHYQEHNGIYEWGVMRNDVFTGQYAQKIVYQRNKVRIWGRDGWRVWTGKFFV
jgi:hypothetical protein